ncbi:sensor histidine kinase [Sorangium sp. So ce291]|uniref:ATP-binding protein n=1 Tax=Sorangium sp. So ce291 TaxID=3133294 RepID=UPI003F6153CA
MGFLERLRAYLERVERAPEGVPAVRVDLAAHRRHFVACCDRDQEERTERLLGLPVELQRTISRETEKEIEELRDSLPAFVEEVADQILETLAPGASPEELTHLINVAISWQLHVANVSTGSRGLDEEIGRLASSARSQQGQRGARDGWRSPARYAFEIRAIRRQVDRHVLTRSGAAFLELPGSDAVRWLLALEVAQSLGPADEWRVSPELAVQLLREPAREIDVDELVHGSWAFSLSSVRRLGALRLLHYQGQDPGRGVMGWSYRVFDQARPLLEELAEMRPTPFAVLANALLRDEVAHTLDSVRPDPERALRESAASATALQARMVVHEIRNALVPAQGALSRLVRDLGEATQAEPLRRHRDRVDAGIQRALAFADEMLRVANLGVEPAAPFDAAAAVRDAIAGMATELNGSLRYIQPEGAPAATVGPRARFVLAVTNLLRNAAQAVAGLEGVVEVSMQARAEQIVLRVDDSGPGVPAEQRRAVFEPGVALRAGGSGQGLALVRQVVEGEMQGSVTCSDSPLGGARFEIVIPAMEAKGR